MNESLREAQANGHERGQRYVDTGICLHCFTECDACEGDFSVEKTKVIARCDAPLADHQYEQGPYKDGRCDIDGWNKVEHELNRDLVVHESCFLEHNDILVRI